MPWNFCSACWEGDLEDGEIRAAAAILPSWGYNQWQNGKGAEPKQERETVALGSPAEPLDDSLLSSWVVEFSVTGGGLVAKSCLTLATPWAVAFQARLSIGFSRQEYWTGLPFSSPGETSWSRDWICTCCIGRRNLYHWTTWEALLCLYFSYNQYKVFKPMSIIHIKIWTLPFVKLAFVTTPTSYRCCEI